jgi:hypothetical protein
MARSLVPLLMTQHELALYLLVLYLLTLRPMIPRVMA